MRTKPKAFKLTDIMIEPKPVDRRLDPARANRAPRGPENAHHRAGDKWRAASGYGKRPLHRKAPARLLNFIFEL
jgi:hypothetical protein